MDTTQTTNHSGACRGKALPMRSRPSPFARDFSRPIVRALSSRGIAVVGATNLPGSGSLPYATGERGYMLDDNGCMKIRTYSEVIDLAHAL